MYDFLKKKCVYKYPYPKNLLVYVCFITDAGEDSVTTKMGQRILDGWMPSDIHKSLAIALSTIKPNCQRALELYFRELMTVNQIAERMNLSSARVSQLINEGAYKLRKKDVFDILMTGAAVYSSKNKLADDIIKSKKDVVDDCWKYLVALCSELSANRENDGTALGAERLALATKDAFGTKYSRFIGTSKADEHNRLLPDADAATKTTIEEHKKLIDACDMAIYELGMTTRAENCIMRSTRAETVGELLKLSPERLMNTPNLGKKTYDEIVSKLEELGFDMRQYRAITWCG